MKCTNLERTCQSVSWRSRFGLPAGLSHVQRPFLPNVYGKRSRLANLAAVVDDKFKVFLSWSGNLAKAVAAVWADLLAETFDAVAPFMSEENIGAGERGLTKIATELAGTSFGIIIVTQENQTSPWLNYEAGALSKNLGDETVRVAPCLVDFPRKNDATGPLSQFQGTMLDKGGVERILLEIAKVVGVDEAAIKRRFARSWLEYEERFKAARAANPTTPHRRSDPEMLDEILTIVRDLARSAEERDSLRDMQAWFEARTARLAPVLTLGGESARERRAEKVLPNTPSTVPTYVPVLEVGDRVRFADGNVGSVEEIRDAVRPGEYPTAVVKFEDSGGQLAEILIPCKRPPRRDR